MTSTEIDRAGMKDDEKRYFDASHLTKKYVKPTQILLKEFWVRSCKHREDIWIELTNYDDSKYPKKITGTSIKAAFRRHVEKRQKGRCCYCRRTLDNNGHAKPIEHILPRNTYPQYSLQFWNLAVSCADCNLAKTGAVWDAFPKERRSYPRPHNFARSFHPAYHSYDQHIHYLNVEGGNYAIPIYKGKTPQGRHLCSVLLFKIAAKRVICESNVELQSALSTMNGYSHAIENLNLERLSEFQTSLNERISFLFTS